MQGNKISKLLRQELESKRRFVRKLGITLSEVGVIDIDYELLEKDGMVTEYLVLFKDGAYSVRNCTANSKQAILAEVARLVSDGYYDEVATYKEIKKECISL